MEPQPSPAIIYLQPHMFPEITWCTDPIEDTDVKYERSDVVDKLKARVEMSSDIMRAMADRLERESRWDIHDRKAVLNILRANAVLNDRAIKAREEQK